MAGNPITSTLASSNGFTPGVALDYQKYGGTSVQVTVVSTGGGLTYSVEYSADALNAAGSSVGMNWFSSGSSNLSTHAFISYAFPIQSLRYNITAGTSNTQLTGTVIQSM